MIVKNNGFLTIEQLQDQYLNGITGNTPVRTTDGKSFQEILESTQGSREVRFSKHAAQRLSNRNIELTKDQKERLQAGTAKASQKGIRESLVLVDQLAFIVNIPNNTVVTAMQQNETGTILCAFFGVFCRTVKTYWHFEQYLPAVKPVLVQVASTAGWTTIVCSVLSPGRDWKVRLTPAPLACTSVCTLEHV